MRLNYLMSLYFAKIRADNWVSFHRYHLENPYWQTFDKYVIPLLDREMDLRRYNELDTSKEVKVENDESLWAKVKEHQTY